MRDDVPPSPDLRPRDRLERVRVGAFTPRERLAAMQRLIDESWALLQANPEGMARFRRRNFKARSIGRRPVAAVWESAVELDRVRYASLDWLRRMKRAAGRPKDLLDLENLADPA